ncbi:hypothetical protein [Prevotella sp. kh1p2]|uniref:hypothetical protein n=1 Tax=Prevotella sp. kh1p2 TaxID=1761883 RepID=UPI0015A69693|nr:hypothetical protein [Prevotella sp. kh1p2]
MEIKRGGKDGMKAKEFVQSDIRLIQTEGAKRKWARAGKAKLDGKSRAMSNETDGLEG